MRVRELFCVGCVVSLATILTRVGWRPVGSDKDKADGYIHMCTSGQVAGVLSRYYQGQDDLILVEYNANADPV